MSLLCDPEISTPSGDFPNPGLRFLGVSQCSTSTPSPAWPRENSSFPATVPSFGSPSILASCLSPQGGPSVTQHPLSPLPAKHCLSSVPPPILSPLSWLRPYRFVVVLSQLCNHCCPGPGLFLPSPQPAFSTEHPERSFWKCRSDHIIPVLSQAFIHSFVQHLLSAHIVCLLWWVVVEGVGGLGG